MTRSTLSQKIGAGVAALSSAFAVSLSAAAAHESEAVDINVSAVYVTDLLFNVDGGERRGVGWMGRGDLVVDLPGRAFGMDGVDFFVDLLAIHGTDFSEHFVQDGQVVSNIDAPATLRPIEAWTKISFRDSDALQLGLIDLNSEFDVQETGRHFINSSHGIGPEFSQSGLNGPSIFPNTSFGAVLSHSSKRFGARFGLFDAMPGSADHPGRPVIRLPVKHGALIVGEAEARLFKGVKLRVGGWHYSSRFDLLVPGSNRRGASSGIYGMAEGTLAKTGSSTLDMWVRAGAARSAVNPISAYVGSGFTFGNDNSKLGVALAHARLGNPGRMAMRLDGLDPSRAETAIELTYSKRLRNGIQLQPNVQYIVHPGWNRQRSNALVAGVRLSIDLALN